MLRPIPDRGFSPTEFEGRTEAAQRMMTAANIDLLFLSTEPEVRYFTGFHTPFWLSPTRPWFVLIPNTGKPVAVIPSIGSSLMGTTWLDDIRTWPAPQPADDGVSLLVDTIGELLPGRGVVGTPMGHETHLRMPLNDWMALTGHLSEHHFVDATDVVRGLRMVKSEAEVAKTAHICSIVSDAFDGLPELLSTGMTEREAFNAFRLDIQQRGADEVPYLVGATGANFTDVIKQPSDRVIEPGDLIMFDTGSLWDGYYSDFDRYFAFTHADDAAQQAHRTVWDATEAGLAMLGPGVMAKDLFGAMAEVLVNGGSLGNDVGRLGHGLGMQLTEWPSNTAADDTVIQEGMVLTLEPGMTFASGRMMLHEENVVVRADGPEMLSRRAPRELPVIT